MRHVDKDFNNPPGKLKKCAARYMPRLLEEKEKHDFRNSCYNKAVKDDLVALYHGKCAYCETDIVTGSYPRIDHYRPKINYYWLAYEWSNLLPVCEQCNTKKGDKFPIENEAAEYSPEAFLADSSQLKKENPLLLHPEMDEPQDFLAFEWDGKIIAGSDDSKGRCTIDVCKLNRTELRKKRKKQVAEIFSMFKIQAVKVMTVLNYNPGDPVLDEKNKRIVSVAFELVFEKLLELRDPQTPDTFTLLGRYMYEEFDYFFTGRLSENICKHLLTSVFQNFKEKRTAKYG